MLRVRCSLHYCIIAMASIAQTASLQWYKCADNKYKPHDINMLSQKRLNGMIVAELISGKNEEPPTRM